MFLRKYASLGVKALLGIFLPRNDGGYPGGTSDDQGAIDRAAALEAANARIAELEAMTEEKIRASAEELVHDIFPQAGVPDVEPRRYARPDDDATQAEQLEAPTLEQQVAQLSDRVTDREIEDASRELQARLDHGIATKYSNADKFRVLGQIARSGNQPINIEKLLEVSHNVESQRLESYYNARRASESSNTRTNVPPPIPTNPGGVPLSGNPSPTLKTATSILVQGLKEKLGWGSQ